MNTAIGIGLVLVSIPLLFMFLALVKDVIKDIARELRRTKTKQEHFEYIGCFMFIVGILIMLGGVLWEMSGNL